LQETDEKGSGGGKYNISFLVYPSGLVGEGMEDRILNNALYSVETTYSSCKMLCEIGEKE
jgi:hypothetical protein